MFKSDLAILNLKSIKSYHYKNQFYNSLNLLTTVDCPSHANSKNAVLVKYLVGG